MITGLAPGRDALAADDPATTISATDAAHATAAVDAAEAIESPSTAAPPPYTLSLGIQANAFRCDSRCIYSQRIAGSPSGDISGAALNNVTLSGTARVTPQLKVTLAAHYTGMGQKKGSDQVDLLMGVVRLELSDKMNFWAGRFFTPSDRVNLDGPYLTNDLTPFVDQVADSYPGVHSGAANGVTYWGDFGRWKVNLGMFHGPSLDSAVRDKGTPLAAARVMYDFWDKEEGYLLRSSTYGTQNVLALALAGQSQDGRSAWNVDGLLDRKLHTGGVLTVEFEYQKDNGLTSRVRSDGAFLMASYLLAPRIGKGQLQPLLKYSVKRFDAEAPAPAYRLRTLEANLNYVMNGESALVGVYYLKQRDFQVPAPLTSEGVRYLSPQELGLKVQFRL